MVGFCRLVIIVPFAVFVTAAQELEDFRVEVTAGAWHNRAEGTLQAGPLPVALHGDLNLQPESSFLGKLVFKPGRRQRIVVEGGPLSYTGVNNLARSITYNGRTYAVQETVASKADLTYLFGGYQFDLLSRPQGHFGLEAGGAYLDGSGTIRGVTSGLAATREQQFGIPLAGAEFRIFVLPGSHVLNVNGEVKGMPLGGYGRFFLGGVHVGVGLRRVTFQAGYEYMNADIHENRAVNPTGINPVIQGPVFSVQLRDR
jgi:hypothetical protein